MQHPPSDRSKKNPYATPSAWPRAPEQTFHLKVPKAPPGTQPAARTVAPKPAAPAPKPPSAQPSGASFPAGYFSPSAAPTSASSGVEPPARAPQPIVEPVEAAPVVEAIAPEPVVDIAPDIEPEVAPAPPFIAPPQAPFVAPRRAKKRQESRAPLFIAAGVAAVVAIAGGAWLLLRQPEATVEYETVTPAEPVAQQPVVTPPAFLGLAEEPAEEPELRGAAEPVQTASVSRPAARAAAPQPALPSGPQPYSGGATPAPSVAVQPLRIPPPPAPPPPASAPGPQTPVADPDAPQTTRDPTSGD